MKLLKKLRLPAAALALIALLHTAWACTSTSKSDAGKGTAAYAEAPEIVNEAPTPEGWPALTPVGEVRVKTYPAYRAATIAAEEGGSDYSLFRPLFNHIKRKDIAMTAPVEMTYNKQGDADSMSFLYRTTDMGESGADSKDPNVKVKDIPEMTVVSIGVKGGYTHGNFERSVAKLRGWLISNDGYKVNGEPRYLGYNSPFVFPAYRRYGEVQIPVVKTD